MPNDAEQSEKGSASASTTTLGASVPMPNDAEQSEKGSSPSFKSPPVVEVVCGIQFSPIPGWLTSHCGLFWHEVRDKYPRCEDHPPLGKLKLGHFEEGDEIEVGVLPPLRRVFLIDSSESYLMQVQQNRFVHNWRKLKDEVDYPRFEAAYGKFLQRWNQFTRFLASAQLPPPRIEAYELTYVNVFVESGVAFPRDTWRFLNFYREFPLTASGAPPRVLNLKVGWPLDNELGKLSLSVKHGRQNTEPPREVLIAEFSAQGAAGKDAADMQSWFRAAHDEIVYTFTALTTEHAHTLWEKIE